MTDDTLPLAAEFPAATQERWRKLTEAALKGADFDKKLVSRTYDGLKIEPLYPRAVGARPVAGRKALGFRFRGLFQKYRRGLSRRYTQMDAERPELRVFLPSALICVHLRLSLFDF